ncbi:unnamed protein product [Ilex paraguariensis]|uniref:BURP domain-containing protein n=1 Tax=Ilex paraguariensis TaxID=185542 RepID=A0ABC8TMM8_9AQUA
MEFRITPIFTFLSVSIKSSTIPGTKYAFFYSLALVLVTSFASLPSDPEAYWKSVLPNTPMPKAVKDLLHPEWMKDKNTVVKVGKDAVGKDHGLQGIKIYVDGATMDQLHQFENFTLYFLENDMKEGTKMNLQFTKATIESAFLPRAIAESIPFASKELPEIFKKFLVTPKSVEGETMKKTIKKCEKPGIKAEEKYCATSLEEMIDFSSSKLGKRVKAMSTEVENETQLQKFSITGMVNAPNVSNKGVKKMAGEEAVVCHKLPYAYAVFYCHKISNTKAYKISLEGADGTKAKAVGVCHFDTSAWNPKHFAFQVLKVEPGTVPICHVFSEEHIVWVPMV